jgi:pSer/pThr/pTyr-binding forkhead associated (FHA) protein
MLKRTRALVGPTSTSHLVSRNKHVGKLGHNEIALYVSDFEDPLITSVTDEIVLGRVSRVASITEQPSVDLSGYQAVERGVSRAHAALRRYPTGDLALVDMDSTNGTWLNNTRLTPHLPTVISNGARIVLAKMTLYVYF